MRKLIMAVAVLGMSATMNFAKAQCVNEYGNKEPFAVEFSRRCILFIALKIVLFSIFSTNLVQKAHTSYICQQNKN